MQAVREERAAQQRFDELGDQDCPLRVGTRRHSRVASSSRKSTAA